FPQSISTYFYKFQSISIILSPYHPYLLIPFLTLLIYSLNGYQFSSSFVNRRFMPGFPCIYYSLPLVQVTLNLPVMSR
ncbi:MAG: hypothetical protein AB1422_15915, partial [bacterium]